MKRNHLFSSIFQILGAVAFFVFYTYTKTFSTLSYIVIGFLVLSSALNLYLHFKFKEIEKRRLEQKNANNNLIEQEIKNEEILDDKVKEIEAKKEI